MKAKAVSTPPAEPKADQRQTLQISDEVMTVELLAEAQALRDFWRNRALVSAELLHQAAKAPKQVN